uniref:Uncharacterized protein n=1 Tax=Anguilla anguilla TaxID=7936 RepID=A0A0E9X6Q5_ANGAN
MCCFTALKYVNDLHNQPNKPNVELPHLHFTDLDISLSSLVLCWKESCFQAKN